ncbi:MAG: hypothetical protein K6F61_04160 [Clostridiales bacterium]|nr:hypothetical protein [Clostridiales bacterium]
MKTMEKLCKRFNRMNPCYHAELDWINSYKGWYTVIIESEYEYPAHYHFPTCNDFKDWINGVVLDYSGLFVEV